MLFRSKPKVRAKGPRGDALTAEVLTMLTNARRERVKEKAQKEEEAMEAPKEEKAMEVMKELRGTVRKEAGKEATGEVTSSGKAERARAKAKVS